LTTTHLTNSSTGSDSNRDVAFPKSSRRSVHNGRQACGSSAAKQTVSRSSNVCDIAAGDGRLASYSFDCGGAVRLLDAVEFDFSVELIRVIGVVAD
jgi:hypothetical protein